MGTQIMIQQTLESGFGFSGFRDGQKEVVEQLVNGNSAIAVFPTGSGKSLCYQLPALILPNLTLVVAPLLALIEDQLAFMHSKGIAAASIDSTKSHAENLETYKAARSGQIKILMVSVERFRNERFREFLKQIKISLLVVDEAHCISEWGHNFRPDYLKLSDYRKEFNIPQVLLLTATATPMVVEDMLAKFSLQQDSVFKTGFHRSNLHLNVVGVDQKEKPNYLIKWLYSKYSSAVGNKITVENQASSIVYVTQQKTADEIAKLCCANGFKAAAYHAGMSNDDRTAVQTAFMDNEIDVVVATIAFGMGIDKSDIRNVIHYDLPKSIEGYSQEIGRAGRDGLQSNCQVMANLENIHVLENFVYGDTPERSGIEYVLNELSALDGRRWEVMLSRLSTQSNIRSLPLKTLLVYLEMLRIIKPMYSFFADISFKALVEEADIINRFNGERKQFVIDLFNACPKAKIWSKVDFEVLEQKGIKSRDRVVKALEYFEDQGLIELKTRTMIDLYQVNTDFNNVDIANKLEELFSKKEVAEIERLEKIIRFFAYDNCLSHTLANYFGDNSIDKHCGTCSVCHGNVAQIPDAKPMTLPNRKEFIRLTKPLIDLFEENQMQSYLSSESICRFLCGLPQPAFTPIKANRLDGFGALSDYRYKDIREWVMNLRGAQ